MATDLHAAHYLRSIGADRLHDDGVTGSGIGIALVDTGVTEVPGLVGRLGRGVNLSGVGAADATHDPYAHGTHIAGLVAGIRNDEDYEPFEGGVAPGATVHPIKVAAPDGSTDVAHVIAAIQWAVAHRDELGIRVVNLSFGTDSPLDWAVDPLNYAVQRAWESGVVVVVAAGNEGPGASTISKPGDDPYVLTVGASQTAATGDSSDDAVDPLSSSGPVLGLFKPDVVAPGQMLASYLVEDSFISRTWLQERDPSLPPDFAHATGTSFAAGLVSGAVALLLQAHEDWGPDEVKAALTATATRLAGDVSPYRQGHGLIDVAAAARLHLEVERGDRPTRHLERPSLADLRRTRGSLEVAVFEPHDEGRDEEYGVVGSGEGKPDLFDSSRLLDDGWTPEGWRELWGPDGSRLKPTHWLGHSWNHESWDGHRWRGAHWVGHRWRGHRWWGHRWR